MGEGPLCTETIPPMPTDLQELQGWLSDQNFDLRNAIEFGNAGLVGQIGVLIGQGASQPRVIGSRRAHGWPIKVFFDVITDRCCRSEKPVHRCCQCEWCAAVTRESRYGFRGVKVGAASHPGPPRTRARARMEAEAEAEVVL